MLPGKSGMVECQESQWEMGIAETGVRGDAFSYWRGGNETSLGDKFESGEQWYLSMR